MAAAIITPCDEMMVSAVENESYKIRMICKKVDPNSISLHGTSNSASHDLVYIKSLDCNGKTYSVTMFQHIPWIMAGFSKASNGSTITSHGSLPTLDASTSTPELALKAKLELLKKSYADLHNVPKQSKKDKNSCRKCGGKFNHQTKKCEGSCPKRNQRVKVPVDETTPNSPE